MVDFVGGTGPDTWLGTEQADTAAGNGGDDSLTGNGGNDILSGGEGADRLDGGNGDDILFSQNRDPNAFAGPTFRAISTDFGAEADTLIGGSGDDYIIAGYGDTVDGGSSGSFGNRLFISFRGATSGVNADFRLMQTQGGSVTIGGATITNIQDIGFLEGSEYNDFLVPIDGTYGNGANVYGLGGDDHILASRLSGANGTGLYGGDGNDIVDGRNNLGAPVFGDAGNDTLYSYGSARGGDGNDNIYGSGKLFGDAGDDIFYISSSLEARGGTGNDIFYVNLFGTGDNVFGDEGDDIFVGGKAWDIFTGGGGNDTIGGGEGEQFSFQTGSNSYGGDIAVYSGNVADYAVSQNVSTGVITITDQRPGSPDGTDALTNIEFLRFANGIYSVAVVVAGNASGLANFTGTANQDSYYGSEDANTGSGQGGSDTLHGGGGADMLQGNVGGDHIDGGTGNDTLYSNDQSPSFGTPAYGTSWTAPVLDTGSDLDTLLGGDGDDRIFAGYGDTIDGGAGNDMLFLSLLGASSGITMDFRQTVIASEAVTLRGLEWLAWLQGSNFADDFMLGNFGSVFGMGGDDRLISGAVTNYIDGGDGNDFIDGRGSYYLTAALGGDGDDIIYINLLASADGGGGNDRLIGGDAWDFLTGGAGNDIIDGGAQSFSPSPSRPSNGDVAIYSGNVADYLVTLDSATGAISVVDRRSGSPDGTDSLTNVEFLKFADGTYVIAAVLSGQASGVTNFVGTSIDDGFHGSEEVNTAIGNGGNDILHGHGSNDVLQGNAGGDYLDGGAGDDTLYSANQTGAFNTPYSQNPWTAPTLDTGAEADTLVGGVGYDRAFVGFNDTVSGVEQLFISFMGASVGVVIDFRQAAVANGTGMLTGIRGVNWVQGSEFADDITLGGDNGGDTPVFGMGGNDRLIAGHFTTYLDGGDGNDVIDGRGSTYVYSILGGAGDDTLYLNSSGVASGGDGNDLIIASPYGSNRVFGDGGNDTLTGGVGEDTLDGGTGNDIISGGGGSNTLRGGIGDDRFEVTAADTTTVIEGGADLDTLAVSGAFTLGTSSSGIEIIALNAATLTLTSSQFGTALAANTRLGGNGSVVVTMASAATVNGSGFTVATGAAVTLTVNGSAQNDTVTGVNGIANTLNGASGNDVLSGGTVGDTLRGDIGNDELIGGTGIDMMDGGSGDDIIVVDNDADVVIGGDGIDTVRFVAAVTHVAATDVERFENVGGNDVFATLNALDNSYAGGTGADLVYGGDGGDTIGAAAGGDALFGQAGNDVIDGGGDADKLDGGADNDIVSGGADGDSMRGGDGDDVLDGGSGNDAMNGGTGIDIFTGGEGRDKFRFRDGDTGNTIATADRITDLDQAQGERISLTLMDAIVGGADDAFTFIGTAAFGNVAGELRYELIGGNTYVMGDTDGDGASDFMIRVDGAVVLTGADFSL